MQMTKGFIEDVGGRHKEFSLVWGITKRGSMRISWAKCCAPVEEGGLGVRSIRIGPCYGSRVRCVLAGVLKWDGPGSSDMSRIESPL
ncbi:hypothetical protein ACS0TY_006159 [Phlomoides rotata]